MPQPLTQESHQPKRRERLSMWTNYHGKQPPKHTVFLLPVICHPLLNDTSHSAQYMIAEELHYYNYSEITTRWKKESPFGILFLRGDMNQDSQVKENFCENSKHCVYQGEVYFDCPYLSLKAIWLMLLEPVLPSIAYLTTGMLLQSSCLYYGKELVSQHDLTLNHLSHHSS